MVCINNDYNEDEGNISIGSLTAAAERGEATTTAGEGKSRWGSLLSIKVPPPTKCIIYCAVPGNILFMVVNVPGDIHVESSVVNSTQMVAHI